MRRSRPKRQSRHYVAQRITIAALSAAVAAAIYFAGAEPQPTQPPMQVAVYGYQIVRAYPHDRNAFTQGLIYRGGFLYEGTGLNGHSTLRKVRIETGEIVEQVALAERHFGEGITDWGQRLLQLTWRSNLGFVYDLSTMQVLQTFTYDGEGWGLTHDSSSLILSDGTSRLRFLDPATFEEIGSLMVRDGGRPLANLNELEYIRGEVYANVWRTDRIVTISPSTGQVTGWIDLSGLLSDNDRSGQETVLNGIAYDAQGDRLFVTGKLWPKLFEIKLVRR